MRKQSGQVHSRESSATLQLTVSLLYQQQLYKRRSAFWFQTITYEVGI